jgi:hypothetical protein
MSKKSPKIASLIENYLGQRHDAHYLAYFACFNEGLYYEAHDVLEKLWLEDRGASNSSFYKGLIQLAGAFVHLKKGRLRPAAALFKLAAANLKKYPPMHEDLDVVATLKWVGNWLQELEAKQFAINPLNGENAPKIYLRPGTQKTTLVIATRNTHKVQEIRAILSGRFEYMTL